MIPLWFLPFAIACGNTFILKPSERDPRPSELIFELIDEIDEIPAGVCNLVHGAHDAVNGLLDHPGVDAISFVGQASTARYVAERSAATGKRCQALGGAKNSLVVMPDADLDKAVPAIMSSSFGAAGQRCLAGSVAVARRRRRAPGRGRRGASRGRARARRRPRRRRGRRGLPAGRPGGARARRRCARAGGGRRRRGRARRPRGVGRRARRHAARPDDRRDAATTSPRSRATSCSARCSPWFARRTSTARSSS